VAVDICGADVFKGMIEGRVLVRDRPDKDWARLNVVILGVIVEIGCGDRDRDANVLALC